MSELQEFLEQAVPEVAEQAEEAPKQAEEPEDSKAEEPEAERPEAEKPEAEKPEESEDKAEPKAKEDDSKPGMVPIAALLDEREKRQAAQRQLDELQKRDEPGSAAPDAIVDPEGFAEHFEQRLRQENVNTRIAMSQSVMKMLHDDYEDAEKRFLDMAKDNPALAQQMVKAELPAQFVYDTAKKAERLEKLENVDEWEARERERIRKEVEQELKAKMEADSSKSVTPSLAGVPAAASNKRQPIVIEDPLETTFKR